MFENTQEYQGGAKRPVEALITPQTWGILLIAVVFRYCKAAHASCVMKLF